MLFINFVCLFYLMVLVASHTISKSIDRADLLDDAVDSIDDHQPQKHHRRDKDNKRHLFWWRKCSALKGKQNESKTTTRIAKEVSNATVATNKQMQTEILVPKEKKAKIIEKTKSPQHNDDDWQTGSDKSNVNSSDKYVKIMTTKVISISREEEEEKVRSKGKKKKKKKTNHGHSTRARKNSDDPREKHRRDLPVRNHASSYMAAASAAGYQTTDPTLSHYYRMLAEMSTKLDKLMRLYSNSYGLGGNRVFTLPSLQELKQNSNRFTDPFPQNKVLAQDDFEGTDMLESLLSKVKFRAIETIAKHTPALNDLITNAVITTTFSADPMIIHYDTHHPNVMQMDLEWAAATIAPSTKGINKKPVMNTVKSLKKGRYNDEEANYLVVQPGGTRKDRAVDDPPVKSGTVGEQIGKQIKNIYDKVKQSVEPVQKTDNATKKHDQKKMSSLKTASQYTTSTKSNSIKLKVNLNPNKTTRVTTNKVFVYTKLPRGKYRKDNVHSTKRHSSKHKKNRKEPTHNTSTTLMTVVTEDEDYAALSLIEQMLSREVRPNMAQLLSTAINPTIKRHYRRAVDDAETGRMTNISLQDIPSNDEDPNTDTPLDETSYEGLTKKISYNDFVDGYKHYLKFEKDMGHSNFSNMVRYQAHRHHDVDDIGKFILDKLPQLPIIQERYKRDFFDDDDDDQDISTKSEESWFRKHFYYLADRSVPPKKFHSSQVVPLKSPVAARDGTTGKPNTKLMTKKLKPKTHRYELQSADGEKLDDLEELAWMLKRSSSATVTLDTANTPQNSDHDLTPERSSRDVTTVRPARLFSKMFSGKRTAKKSPRKHTKKHSKRPVKDARLPRIRRHEVNKKLKSKYNYVLRDEAEPTKCTVPSNLFDQVAADEQKTKEKRDRIETANATTDRAIEEGKGKKVGYVNVELVPATTVGTLKKFKERGRFAKFLHSFGFRVKALEKRQKRAVTHTQKSGLLKKIQQIFKRKPKAHKDKTIPKDYGTVTRKLSAYNPAKYAKNLYEIPHLSDNIRNTDYPDLTTASRSITSAPLVNYWTTKDPFKAVQETVSRVQQLYEESRVNSLLRTGTPRWRGESPPPSKYMTRRATKLTPENFKDNAEKIAQIRKDLENIELNTSSPFDWSFDPVGKKLKDFEDSIRKGYLPNEITKGSIIINPEAILRGQSKHTTPQNSKINDDAYDIVKKNSAADELHAAPVDNSVAGIINYIYKKPYAKEDVDDSHLKAPYKDKIANIPAVTNNVKESYLTNAKPTYDDFNDLIIWNSDILHSDSVLKSTMPPVNAISIKDEFAEFLKGNQVYAEHTFSKKVQIADQNQKNSHPVSKGGKEARAIKNKGRNAKYRWDFRRDLTYDNIEKRLNALLSRTSPTERYDRMSTENYNKMMIYESPNLRDILTDTTTLPYEKDIDYLRAGMKMTQNTLFPGVKSFALYKKNKSEMMLLQLLHPTPLPMKHKDFNDFLKLNDIDVESVTKKLLENGTRTIISPTQNSIYKIGNSKSNKNHVDKSQQIRVNKASASALADAEDPTQDDCKQVFVQLNIPKAKERDQESGKGKDDFALNFGSRTTDNGRVSVKDSYRFQKSLLRQHILGATLSEPHARPKGTLDFHNYFEAAKEFKDKLERKRKEKRKDKREAEEESYTAKNVAEIEVIVDLIKNPEAFEELSRMNHLQNTISAVADNKEVKPVNSIQVHIGVPRYGSECHSAKRSLQNIKKVFIAKLCSPVDLEYQVKSYVIPPSTVIPTGVYLLLDNNDSSDGNLVLKPIFHNINVAVVKQRQITNHNHYSTEKITTTQTLSKLNKVTLTRDFVAAVNKHLMQLCELLSVNDTHHVHARAANEEKPRRSVSWKKLKKYFHGEHVCDCNCKANGTMCNSCAASDKVMTELIFEIDCLIKYMNDHCTEIQTYFYKNPSGGKKLKDSVKLLDKNLETYYKRVKGKCQGKSCDGFRFLDKRFFYSTPKYKYTDMLNYFPYGINMDDVTLTENLRTDVFSDRNLNKKDEPDNSETTDTKNKTKLKNVYSLDNVNVNIICKDNNVTTTKVTPERLYISGQGNNAPFTEPILVRVENKQDLRNSNKYNKREVGQIDSPLNADSSGSFWNDYFNKINESALIFVATGMIPDTGTSKVNNDRNETTVENMNLLIEKTSYLPRIYLTTLHGSNYDNNTTGDRLQTRSATLSYESIISTEAPNTDKPLQEDLNELIKLLDDVYVKDFNDVTTNIHPITKKPVDTVESTLCKNSTSRKDIKEKSKSKCAENETADTDTPTDSIVSNCTTTDSLSNNTLPDVTTDNVLTDDTAMFSFVANISATATEDWRSSTKESRNLFPYLKRLKDATLGWFNYDKSKEDLDIDNLAPVTHEKDQLFRVMQVLGIKNKKEAYTNNHAKSQGTTEEDPTILIFNDNDEQDSQTPDIDNSSGMDVLDIHATADPSNNLLLSLLNYESQKLAKEWKRYAGRNHNTKSSANDETNKKKHGDSVMKVTVGIINKTEKDTKKIKNETNIKNKIQNEIDITKKEQEEKVIEQEIQYEQNIISLKEKEIVKEKQKKERYLEKLRKLKNKGCKTTQKKKERKCKIKVKTKEKSRPQMEQPTERVIENAEKLISDAKCKEKRVKEEKKEGNRMLEPMDKNAEPGKTLPTCKIVVTDKTTKSYETFITKVLGKLELPVSPPSREGFINRILNKFNVSWGTSYKKQEEGSTEAIPMEFNDYYDSDAIMSVSLITGDKGETATERRSIVQPMDPQKSDDGSDQPLRLCDLQDTFSYALRCLQQDKEWFQEYAKRIPCHRYMNTPKCFCIEPEKQNREKIAVLKEPKRTFRWDWKRNRRSLYVEDEDDPLNDGDDDRATDDEELLDGNTHSLRDALISNDGFERMYKDEFGIYRIETRKKRSSVDTDAVIQGLKDFAPIKVPKNEIYAMPRDSVTITCTLDASKGPISWAMNEGPIPDNAVVEGAHLAIQKVRTENSGNYTCFQCFRSGLLTAGKRESWTLLTVVKLPVFRIVTFLLYSCRPLCTVNDVGALRELGHHMTKAACPGSSCTVQVHRPTSMEDQTNHSSLASVFVDVAPARRAARCGVECARNMYCSLTRLIAENAATIATIPVIVSWKVRNTTLTPLVRQKIFVMQTSNIPDSNPLRTQAKWTSGELDVKMYCPDGYYLVYEMKLCVTNPVRYLPVIPRRVRRYEWWRPSYMCVFACMVLGAVCACGANALARGEGAAEGAAEGGRGIRVTTLPCVEPTPRQRISPSRVILPRLFRHASSRISQETKLDLKKIRLPPPPPPPIDFDP